MSKAFYLYGIYKQKWYNFTQHLAYGVTKSALPKGIVHTKNIKYGTARRETYSNFFKTDIVEKGKPLFIYIHGGGFVSGVVKLRDSYVAEFAKHGFYAVSLDYTLSPQAQYPTQIQQIFKAIDKILDEAQKNNIDTSKVLLSAESVGCHFAAIVAACATNHDLYEKFKVDFRHKDDFIVTANVFHSAAISLPDMYDSSKQQSKFPGMHNMLQWYTGKNEDELTEWFLSDEGMITKNLITNKFPPTMVVWAEKDYLRYESFELMEKLKNCGVAYAEFKGTKSIATHGFSIMLRFKESKKCFNATKEFLEPYFGQQF